MSFANLFSWSYWFHQPFSAHGAVLWVWVLGFLALVAGGLVARFIRQKKQDRQIREVYSRIGSMAITLGLLGLLWFFFRQERIPFFAWRFWVALWLLGFIWWAIKLALYTVKRLPAIREEKAKREVMEKYLPHRK